MRLLKAILLVVNCLASGHVDVDAVDFGAREQIVLVGGLMMNRRDG